MWQRIERKNWRGHVLDFVEVAACTRCGRGVDRECRVEYREIDGRVYCVACAGPRQLAFGSLRLVDALQ